MAAIKLLFHIAAPREKVYAAISTIDGLSNWWTKEVKGESKVGGTIEFRFGNTGGHDTKVLELKPNELVKWENITGHSGWAGTIITFQLDDNEGKTRVRFTQDGFKEANDFYASCSFSWSRYMWSLRQLCQTGKGEAYGSENYRK
jgi:uncharacterized protein YndB with AHSA1/START domain